MIELHVKEVKQVQLSILERVHQWCIDNNVQYTLDFGTLIGAIRHKGYIPWDDDIDLSMLRESYDKLVNKFNEDPPKYLKLHSFETDSKYILPYAKIEDTRYLMIEPINVTSSIGINIDIFPFDSVPSDDSLWNALKKKRSFYHKQYYRSIANPFSKGLSILQRFHALLLKMLALGKNARYYNKKKMSLVNVKVKSPHYVAIMCGYDSPKRVFREDFSDYVELEFEGKLFKVLKGYDRHLRILYGDYLQLPPINERVSHHSFKAYKK